MAHKTLIDGTAYEISGGKARVDSTDYEISGGKTLVDGTDYEVAFGPKFTSLFDFGTITPTFAFLSYVFHEDITAPNFDISSVNALLINGVIYEVFCSSTTGSSREFNEFLLHEAATSIPNADYPYNASFERNIANDTWQAFFRSYYEGTYDVSIGILSK